MTMREHDRAPDDVGGALMESAARTGAERVFGDQMDLACRYADLLATEGVIRGLIGPREAPRIWSRHMVNCVAIAELIPSGARVADVGSGAGLPGIVLAIARPDLAITLIEPLARRVAFLSEAVADLNLPQVTVVRARAEDCAGTCDPVEVVTARAVAPLDRLVGWCLPLATVGGRLLAIKGTSAAEEITEHGAAIRRLGGSTPTILRCGEALLEAPVTVVEVVRERGGNPLGRSPRTKRGRGRR